MKQEGSCEYGYDFKVTSVKRCPMNKTEHEKAGARLGCNENQSYHCTPDKCHLSLIEFCYPKKQNLVQSGNCLELAHTGILNQVRCQSFAFGCPETYYLSNELYKYPLCLSIAFSCFTSDTSCLQGKFTHHSVEGREKDCELNETIMRSVENLEKDFESNGLIHRSVEEKETPDWCYVLLTLFIVVVLVVILVVLVLLRRNFKWKNASLCRKKNKKRQTSAEDDNEKIPLNVRNQANVRREEGGGSREEIPPVEPSFEVEEDMPNSDAKTRDEENSVVSSHPGELEYEHIEIMHLLLLLRRHCKNRAFKNFHYLIQTRILEKKQDLSKIIDTRDERGWSLMHYAAEGGSKDILQILLNECPGWKIDDTNYIGHTILDIACKYNRFEICSFLLSKKEYFEPLLEKRSLHHWNAAHFTAVCGNIKNFHMLLNRSRKLESIKGNDELQFITSQTALGLNILDIACINNQKSFCEELLGRDDLQSLLSEPDARGWTSLHYAARSGNRDIFKLLLSKNVDLLTVTKSNKTVLHIICEYGHNDLYEAILNYDRVTGLQHFEDDNGWNALHFCAKGGNLDLFKKIEKSHHGNVMDSLCKETNDGKTVLHICCISKRVEICEYICETLMSAPGKINELQTKRKLWTPAFYVAVEIRQDGTEEKLIEILVKAGLDLTAVSTEKETVLTVACEHSNINLVKYLVDHHPELLSLEQDMLKRAACIDPRIKEIIEDALKKERLF